MLLHGIMIMTIVATSIFYHIAVRLSIIVAQYLIEATNIAHKSVKRIEVLQMNTFKKEIFPKRLILLRESKGVSRQAAADALEISRASLEYYEKGQRLPDIQVLSKIADYFNVSADYLLGRTDVARIDPTQKMQAACEVTGLSEKAVKNLVEIREKGQSADLMIESGCFKAIVCRLNEIENLAIGKKRSQYIYSLMGNDTFYDNLYLNGCEYGEYTDKDYVYSLIERAFNDILEQEHGLYSDARFDYSEEYQDSILLEEYKISKVVSALVEEIQQSADCTLIIKQDNITIRKELAEKLDRLAKDKQSLEERIEQSGADEDKRKRFLYYIEESDMRIKALQKFLEKYDVDFTLKEQKGASNGSNNPQKE